ncbi:MAG: TonB-dependent receptor [Chlorobi bacterium]|nr:TonB-dependent receptor [Chlorobiota bacterium]
MLKRYMLLVATLVSLQSLAQNSIYGTITGQNTGESLIGVNIYISELNSGVISNQSGYYEFNNIPNGKFKIQFSYIGYTTEIKEIVFNHTKKELNICLKPSVIQASEIVVSGGYYSSQHENAVQIEILNPVEITSVGSPSFTESLASVPGVDIIEKGAGIGKPVIRGLSMNEVLVLNNGVRSENQQWSSEHPLGIDDFGIDKIEIIKGPASLLYGSDAIGGVINILKEKPAPEDKIIGDYNVQYYTNTKGLSTNIGIKGSSKSLYGGIRIGAKSHADYIDGVGNFAPNTRFNEKSFKATTGLNKKFGSFNLYYEYFKQDLGMLVPPVIENNLVPEIGRTNNIWYQDLNNQLISSKNKLFFGNIKVSFNAAYQSNLRKLFITGNSPDVNLLLNTFSYELKANHAFNENFDFIFGTQGMNQTNRTSGPEEVIPSADINDHSVFSLAQYKLGYKIRAQAGLRYDNRHIKTLNDNFLNTDTAYHHAELAVDNNYNNISGSIGMSYFITSELILRANFASGHRSPNLAELTSDGMHGVRHEEGNVDLVSEKNYEGDISIHYHTTYFTGDVALFNNSINNYIFISPTSDTTTDGSQIYRYMQTNANLKGGEAGVHFHPEKIKWFHFKSTFSTVVGRQTNGNYLPFIPANKLTFEIKGNKKELGKLKNVYLKLSTKTAFSQNNPAMFETATNGYTLVNAGIGCKMNVQNQTIELTIVASNLLNKKYISHLSTLKPMGIFNMGRNISFGLRVPFGIK